MFRDDFTKRPDDLTKWKSRKGEKEIKLMKRDHILNALSLLEKMEADGQGRSPYIDVFHAELAKRQAEWERKQALTTCSSAGEFS